MVRYLVYLNYLVYLVYLDFSAMTLNHGVDSGCLLNIHEDEQMDSDNWTPLGWIPIIDETKSRRPKQGYQDGPACSNSLFHESWRNFISNFSKQYAGLRIVIYADGIARETIHLLLDRWEINAGRSTGIFIYSSVYLVQFT